MIELGEKVRDQISKFEGIVIGVTEFLNGCTRVGVQSTVLKDGTPIDVEWFDEPQLEEVQKAVINCGPKNTGGPMPSTPKKRPDITR